MGLQAPRYLRGLRDIAESFQTLVSVSLKAFRVGGIAQGPSENHLRKILYIGYILVEE
jgi:hypothetical protein